MADKGKPWQKPYAESVIGHLKDEVVWLAEYTHFQQAYESLSHFLDVVYNYERPHLSFERNSDLAFKTKLVAGLSDTSGV